MPPTARLAEHVCPVIRCKTIVPNRYLMCAPHWRMVPAALQRAVWAAYTPPGASTGAGEGTLALANAQRDAITAVNAKLAA